MPQSDRIILTDVDGVLLEWEDHFSKWMATKGFPQLENTDHEYYSNLKITKMLHNNNRVRFRCLSVFFLKDGECIGGRHCCRQSLTMKRAACPRRWGPRNPETPAINAAASACSGRHRRAASCRRRTRSA